MKFAIYYAEREFAHHNSDPRLAIVDAPSREEAERISSSLAPAGVGTLAVPIRETPWRGVFFDGPQSDIDRDGDEIPSWCVYVGDEEAEPVEKVYWFHDYQAADHLAHRMARDRDLEFIHEASPA